MITKHLNASGINEDQSTNGGTNTTTNAKRAVRASTINTPPPERNEESHIIAPEEAIEALQVKTNRTIVKENHQFVRIRDQVVSRLELKATRNVMLIALLILLFASTWITSIALTMICQLNVINDDMDEEQKYKAVVEQCSLYHWAISYTRFISLIAHSIYQSIGYVIRSKDCFTEPNQAQHYWRRNKQVPTRKMRHQPQRNEVVDAHARQQDGSMFQPRQ